MPVPILMAPRTFVLLRQRAAFFGCVDAISPGPAMAPMLERRHLPLLLSVSVCKTGENSLSAHYQHHNLE
jgi:hypothetical protein